MNKISSSTQTYTSPLNSQKTLSIIVVTLNEVTHIRRLKESIDALTFPGGFSVETILIDGGSSDGTPEIAKACGFSKIITLPNANIPCCRNEGIKKASGDWLAFVDGDCELTQNWLISALPLMDNEQPTILGWPAAPAPPTSWVQDAWWFHWNNKNSASVTTANNTPCIKKDAFRLITTRNMLLNRKTADIVNGFDENLPTGEDTDFVLRATLSNATVLAVPAMLVFHHGDPATLKAFFKQQLWHANRSSYKTIAKKTGGAVGGNAPKFTLLFLSMLFLAIGAIPLAFANALFVACILPLFTLIAGPAFLISLRGKTFRFFSALCILYFAYGFARSLDLCGIGRFKKSWKG